MGIRRAIALVGVAALSMAGFGAAQPAAAGPVQELVLDTFVVTGIIGNDSPPTKILNFYPYLDGDNFSINPVISYSPARVGKKIGPLGNLGIKIIPVLTMFTLNGQASDFNGAVIEGCTTTVNGLLTNTPTLLNQDQLLALQVDTTCP